MNKTIITAIIFLLVFTSGIFAQTPLIELNTSQATVGENVKVNGLNLEPGTEYKIIWKTFTGNWNLGTDKDGNFNGKFFGPEFNPVNKELLTIKTDEDGEFNTTFQIPEDFGGAHDIALLNNSEEVTKAGLRLIPSVDYHPKQGPIGTPIKITVKGLNLPHKIAGWYQILYDNGVTGFLSGMKTKGTSVTTIPATGGIGKHFIEIQNSPFGHPYRALETSPYSYLPTFKLPFEITEGEPVLPGPAEEQLKSPSILEEPDSEPAIWFDPAGDAVGKPTTVYGKGFPVGETVNIYKYGRVGSRVTVGGWDLIKEPITKVTVEKDGSFQKEVTIPDTHGGTHKIGAAIANKELDYTTLQVYRTPVSFKPKDSDINTTPFEVKAGTTLELKLKGIGWSEIENIYAIVYDNHYIGYSCGFSTGGDVVTYLTATGEPGWHFIDIYPTFYRNKNYADAVESPFLYRSALLSWQDHPNPFTFRYAFKIVE